jgi:chromosome segregation ATPase
MKWMIQIVGGIVLCVHLLCIAQQSLAQQSPDVQKITITAGSLKECSKQADAMSPKTVLLWFKTLLISREFFGGSTVFLVFGILKKYIIDAKAAQKDLNITNKKLDEVERRGFENKTALDSISNMQVNLSQLLTSMQKKVELIDQNTKELTTSIFDLQSKTKNTKKTTKTLEQKTGTMQQLIAAISEQVGKIQIDLSCARTGVTESLLEIQALKELDEKQKELLSSLNTVIKNNTLEVTALQKNIDELHQQHQKTENCFEKMEKQLEATHQKLEDTMLQHEVIQTKLSTEYEIVHKENQALDKTLKEMQGVVSMIFHDITNTTNNL